MNLFEQALAVQTASIPRCLETEVCIDPHYGSAFSMRIRASYSYYPAVRGIENIEPNHPASVDILTLSVHDGKQWNVANWAIKLFNEVLTEEILETENAIGKDAA